MQAPQFLRGLLLALSIALTLNVSRGDEVARTNPFVQEDEACKKIYLRIVQDDLEGGGGLLKSLVTPVVENASAGVTVASRAAKICGWLASENKYGKAQRLAQVAVRILSTLKETTAIDRQERIYWEALLLGDYLDRKPEALKLLALSKELGPVDDRVPELELVYMSARDLVAEKTE